MERNELAIFQELETTERQLAHINSRLPELVKESISIELRMKELQNKTFGERVVRWLLRWLRLDGKHREFRALEARRQRITEAIDRFQEQKITLELDHSLALRKIWVKADLGRAVEEALEDFQDDEIKLNLKRHLLKTLDDLG